VGNGTDGMEKLRRGKENEGGRKVTDQIPWVGSVEVVGEGMEMRMARGGRCVESLEGERGNRSDRRKSGLGAHRSLVHARQMITVVRGSVANESTEERRQGRS